ncbi:MAG: type II secretion system protein N [Betaproteobacteria bacterium]
MSEPQVYGTPHGTLGTPGAPPRWRLLSIVALLAAFGVLALVIAQWGWRWFGPAAATIDRVAATGDDARRITDAHLFGIAPATQPGVAAPPSGDLRLLGIIAERGGGGYALFRSARGPLLASVGQDVGAGVRLEAVRPDGVTLMEGGARRDMPLRMANAAPAPSGPRPEKAAPAVVAANVKSSACAAPAGFAGPIVRLNAELLTGMMTTTDAWKALVEPGAGALVVRDQSGFAGNLGLRNGDRVESANGVALAVPADIPAMVLQPLTRSQPVWLAGTRGGKPQHWLYLNAGACPA